MARVKMTLDTIKDLGSGAIAAEWAKALQRCGMDCQERPGEKGPRRVVMVAEVKPVEQDGVCEALSCTIQVSDSVPKRQSRVYELGISNRGDVIVNPDSPDDVSQGTLDEVVPARKNAK